jgi:hypothetical protein
LAKGDKAQSAGKSDKEDPAATKLLAAARAARATWTDFPGASADLTVNLDGKVIKGQVKVNPRGKVEVTLSAKGDDVTSRWAHGMLASVVGHRLGGSEADTPCVFADSNTKHPLGQLIRVIGDDFHSSYRIRDRQILVVNRQMKEGRFSIVVLENKQNAEKHYLPTSYVVNSWDKAGLKSTTSFRLSWKRTGKYDLPVTLLVVSAHGEKMEARRIRLTNWKVDAVKESTTGK